MRLTRLDQSRCFRLRTGRRTGWIANMQQAHSTTTQPSQSSKKMTEQGPPTSKRKLDFLSSPPRTPSLAKSAAAAAASSAATSTAATATSTSTTVRRNLLDVSGARERSSRDEIHGNISMEPALTAIIDTPYFQRLRQVRQLGATHWVSQVK